MGNVIERIEKEILSWPYVTAEPHRFGGLEFRFNKRELGHLHGERVAELVNSGRVSPHHVLPQSGWVSYWINNGEGDVPAVVELFRMRYEQLKLRPQPKREEGSKDVKCHYQQIRLLLNHLWKKFSISMTCHPLKNIWQDKGVKDSNNS